MARSTYAPRETYVGDGATAAYAFSFKIEAKSQLLVKTYNADNVEQASVRGTDTSTLISSVTFDSEDGGGTVNLLSNLTSGHTIVLLLANDSPTQPSQFKNNSSFTLKLFEVALDYLGGAIQRLAYSTNLAVKLPDILTTSDFDPELPVDIVDVPYGVLHINATGDGWRINEGITETTINNAIAAAAAALVSETAAAASETAAAASAAAASASETAAQSAQAQAETAQAAAEAAQSAAATSASNASASAAGASAAQTAAEAAEANAVTQATNAGLSAVAAAASAAAADVSATAAGAAQGAAEVAQAAAEAAQVAAEAAVDPQSVKNDYNTPTAINASGNISHTATVTNEVEFITGNGLNATGVTLDNGAFIGQIKYLINPAPQTYYVEVQGKIIRPGYTAMFMYVTNSAWLYIGGSH